MRIERNLRIGRSGDGPIRTEDWLASVRHVVLSLSRTRGRRAKCAGREGYVRSHASWLEAMEFGIVVEAENVRKAGERLSAVVGWRLEGDGAAVCRCVWVYFAFAQHGPSR